MTVTETIFSTSIGRSRCILAMQTDESDPDSVWNPKYLWYERFDILDYPMNLENLEDCKIASLADNKEQSVYYVLFPSLSKFDIAYEYYGEEFICR